ncbi:uncharacterized protein LOC119675035 [Teleopsis dalmanni]|uniref:uncharacterized protein LOC119675035 n=1 Tax=Teleopsis dalmanni TaxID=139649 RepID=UPI0018CF349B|nr:uncharacterized protein LOC119675035 [Teleopsis dalmanni]
MTRTQKLTTPWRIRTKAILKTRNKEARFTSSSAESSKMKAKIKEIIVKSINLIENMDDPILVRKKNFQGKRKGACKIIKSKTHHKELQKKTKRKQKANIKNPISSCESSDLPAPRKRNKPEDNQVIGPTRGVKRKLADVNGVEQNENVEFNAPAQKRQKRDVDTNIVQLYYPKSKQKRMIAKKKYLSRREEIRSTPPLTRARKRMMPQEKLWEFIDPPKRR